MSKSNSTTKAAEPNPDVVVSPSGDLQLTVRIDKINSEYWGVKVEGEEATYRARREAGFASIESSSILSNINPIRVAFTVPTEQAAGYAIGSVVVVTIAKAEGR